MGVVRAGNFKTVGQSNAQFSGGSLRFDKSKSQYLTRTFGSGGNTSNWTCSAWVKRISLASENTGNDITTYDVLLSNSNATAVITFYKNYTTDGVPNALAASGPAFSVMPSAKCRDTSAWYHCLVNYDGTTGKVYINGVQITNFYTNTQNGGASGFNGAAAHYIGRFSTLSSYSSFYLSQYYFIDGQALTPSSFGYTDPLTNTWRPKKYTGTYGTTGFYLPMDGNTPIGKDLSGNNNDWTPVNFGGSNTIEKATGALPILNTDGGGKVARVGVRTDSYYANLKLAVPFVGVATDVVQQVNGNSASMNSFTANNATFAVHPTAGAPYGTGLYLNSVSDYPNINYTAGTFNFLHNQTGSGTVEFWMYNGAYNTEASMIQGISGSPDIGFAIQMASSTTLQAVIARGVTGSSRTSGTASIPQNTWSHIAVTKTINGSNAELKLYVNGVLSASNTSITASDLSNSNSTYSYFRIGQNIGDETSRGWTNYYMNDLRIYDTVKYTQNFIPASTDPDILPDTPSGVAYSSNVALVPSTDGAVVTTGSGVQLTVANNTDFDIVGGDYSMELFAYAYSTGNIQSLITRGSYSANSGFGVHNVGNEVRLYYGQSEITTGSSLQTNRWHHIAITQSSGRQRIFVDGKLVGTATMSISNNNSNLDIGHSNTAWGATYPHLGFISNVRIIKGSIPTAYQTSSTSVGAQIFTPPTEILTTTSQGATSGDVKLLCCKSQTSATAFDVSPGSITATNAVATNFNPFTLPNINLVRGQESGYATLNPLATFDNASPGVTNILRNGNLTFSYDRTTSGVTNVFGSLNLPSTGKWYWEVSIDASSPTPPAASVAITREDYRNRTFSGSVYRGIYLYDGTKVSNGTYSAYSSAFAVGDLIGVSCDMDTNTISFYKNGISLGSAFTDLSGSTWVPSIYGAGQNSGTYSINFGQNPFKFPPPAGFQPLALANTPRPTIVRPDQYVGIVTYTGTTANPVSIKSTNFTFTPDFVWVKSRSNGESHALYDTVRGATYRLRSDTTGVETTGANELQSFIPGGFTAGNNGHIYYDGYTYVAWCWKAGGAIGVGRSFMIDNVGFATAGDAGMNTGTITPTGASVNTKSGFSIIAFNSGSNGQYTISHGLRTAPALILCKDRDSILDWQVFHVSATTDVYKYFWLNSTQSINTDASKVWGDNLPTSTVFGFSTGNNQLANKNIICYCWAEISGFSKFGSYTGNGSTNFVNVGFRPRWIMIKRAVTNSSPDSTNNYSSWTIYDTSRNTYNGQTPNHLYANKNINEGYRGNASDTSSLTDMTVNALSDGFYLSGAGTEINANTGTYIYAAFAETPSFNLYGGQSNAR